MKPLTHIALALALFGGQANAQLMSTAPRGPAVVVDDAEVLDEATRAFRQAVRLRLEEDLATSLSASQREQFTRFADDLETTFRSEVERRLVDLRGDGILSSTEVSLSLEPLWENSTAALDTAISALRQGHRISPTKDDYDSASAYYRSLLSYTFAERNDWSDWGWLVLAILLSLSAAWGLHRGALSISRRLQTADYIWSARVMRSTAGPLYVTAVLCGLYFGLQSIWLPGLATVAVPQTLVIGLFISLFWLGWQLCGPIATGLGTLFNRSYAAQIDEHVLAVIARLLRVALVMLLGGIVLRGVLQTSISSMIASLGAVALVLAIALRGPMQNLVASLTIFADKPFRIGDMVVLDNPHSERDWGWIEDVGVRSTKFRSLDGHQVSIPNQELLDEPIVNISARPYIRRRFHLGLVYGTEPEKVSQAIEILEDILEDHEGQPEDWPAHVVFEDFGAYDLRLLVQYCYEPPDFWKSLAFDSRVNLEILRRFNEAEIEFAFPTETQIHKEGEGWGSSLPEESVGEPSTAEPRDSRSDEGAARTRDESTEPVAGDP